MKNEELLGQIGNINVYLFDLLQIALLLSLVSSHLSLVQFSNLLIFKFTNSSLTH